MSEKGPPPSCDTGMTPEEFDKELKANMDIIEGSNLPPESLENIRRLSRAMQGGKITGVDEREFIALLSDTNNTLSEIQSEANALQESGQKQDKSSEDIAGNKGESAEKESLSQELSQTKAALLQRCNDLRSVLNQVVVVQSTNLAKDAKISELEKKHREFIDSIASSFNIMPCNDPQTLTNDIKSSITAANLLGDLISRFNLPKYTTNESVLDMLDTHENTNNLMKENQRLNALVRNMEQKMQQYTTLDDTNAQTASHLKATQSMVQKLTDQKDRLLKRASFAENAEKELRQEYQQLQELYHSVSIRAEIAENESSALKDSLDKFKVSLSVPKEAPDQTAALNSIAEQLQLQTFELEDANNSIQRLLNVVQKQNALINTYDKQLNKTPMIQPKQKEKNIPDNFLSDILFKLAEGCQSQVIQDAIRIAETKQPIEVKIIQILQCFIQHGDKLSDEIMRLSQEKPLTNIEQQILAMLENQLAYVEHLANCNDDLSWVATTADRPNLIQSASKVDAFLQSIDVTPDQSIIDFFDFEISNSTMIQQIRIFDDRFGKPKTKEGRFLYDALRQSMLSNLLLRKYSECAREQIAAQAASIRATSFETQEIDELKENLNQMEKQIMEERQQKEKLEKELKESPSNTSQRVLELESQLEETQKSMQDSQQLSIRDLADARSLAVQNEIGTYDLIQQQSAEIDRLRNDANAAREEAQQAQKEALKERSRANTASNLVEDLRRKQTQFAVEANEALQTTKEQVTSRYEKKLAALLESEKSKRATMKEKLEEAEREKSKIEREMEMIRTQVDSLNAFKKERLEQDRTNVTQVREAELAAQQMETRLREELTKLQSKNTILESDFALVNARLKAATEKLKRDKEMFDRQVSIHGFSLEAEYSNKIEEARREVEAEGRKVVLALCEHFKDLVDLSKPIDNEVALYVIEQISTERSKYNYLLSQITETRRILNVPSSIKLPAFAAEVAKNLKSTQAEIDTIRADFDSTRSSSRFQKPTTGEKEWEDWARKLYSQLGGEGVPTRSTLRRRIEETASNNGDNTLVRKLDNLRKQKEILSQVTITPQSSTAKTLCSISHAIRFVRRVQKITGHLPSRFSLSASFSAVSNSSEISTSFNSSPIKKK